MPYNVPMENTIACVQAVKHTDEVREMVKNYEAVDTLGDVELPDYENLDKPFIEVLLYANQKPFWSMKILPDRTNIAEKK